MARYVPDQGDLVWVNLSPYEHERVVILPELERAVNEGEDFASLRQMYGAMPARPGGIDFDEEKLRMTVR